MGQPILPRVHTARLAMICTVMLGMIAIHAFWVYAFYRNGLHHYSYLEIAEQHTPRAGTFPLDQARIPFPLTLLLLTQFINWLLLPWFVVWGAFLLRQAWPHLHGGPRTFYLLPLCLAVPALFTMWSPLGQSILTWLAD